MIDKEADLIFHHHLKGASIIMKSPVIYLALLFLAISVTAVCAGSMPDYKCREQASRCEKRCDDKMEEAHEDAINFGFSGTSNTYQKCLDRCREMEQRCNDRQRETTRCAETYMSCIERAAGDKDAVESCREGYRQCKRDI
jgi:hypothetical protein